jgi:hypothetical protein
VNLSLLHYESFTLNFSLNQNVSLEPGTVVPRCSATGVYSNFKRMLLRIIYLQITRTHLYPLELCKPEDWGAGQSKVGLNGESYLPGSGDEHIMRVG